jgi:hypothetical protein
MAAWNFVRKSGMIYHQQQGFCPSTQERLVEVEGNDENPPFWSLRVGKIRGLKPLKMEWTFLDKPEWMAEILDGG